VELHIVDDTCPHILPLRYSVHNLQDTFDKLLEELRSLLS
jgi:hypothetical protein